MAAGDPSPFEEWESHLAGAFSPRSLRAFERIKRRGVRTRQDYDDYRGAYLEALAATPSHLKQSAPWTHNLRRLAILGYSLKTRRRVYTRHMKPAPSAASSSPWLPKQPPN